MADKRADGKRNSNPRPKILADQTAAAAAVLEYLLLSGALNQLFPEEQPDPDSDEET